MKKWLILLLVTVFMSPAMAERPKLKGPSRPKPRKVTRVETRRHCRHCRPYRLRRYSRRPSYICHQPQQVIIIVQPQAPPPPKPKAAPAPRHKTIHIGSSPQRTMPRAKTRNQILKESRAKVRS